MTLSEATLCSTYTYGLTAWKRLKYIWSAVQYTDDHQTTFLVSSLTPLESNFFQGYCFVGSDLVFGDAGRKEFSAATGTVIRSGLDGKYVSIRKDGDAVRFDTDYSGYNALYYFHDGTIWVVSNSFAQVVDFLRSNGLPIRPNYPHLFHLGAIGLGAGQLFSFETSVHGVRLLPRDHALLMAPHRPILERIPLPLAMDYGDALSDHLHTWVSRVETYMTSDSSDLSIDLSGGLDSRTNFGLAVAARRRLAGGGAQPIISSGKSEAHQTDYAVAETLTNHYGFELNGQPAQVRYRLSGEEAFYTWRNLSMGVYSPLYVPTMGPSPSFTSLIGSGGENHRALYETHGSNATTPKFVGAYAQRLGRSEYAEQFIKDAYDALSTVTPFGGHPMRAHYRAFRSRYHGGRQPRFYSVFTPLDCRSADVVMNVADTARVEEGQFNYDVMHVLDPELLQMPFDTPEKAPTSAIRARLAEVALPQAPNPGRIWSGPTATRERVDTSRVKTYELFKQAFDQALDNTFVTDFWGQDYIKEATELMSTYVSGESIGNAANGRIITAVLSADLVTPS